MDDREDDYIEQYQRRRETFLTILLAVLAGGSFTVFLIFVSFGFFFWVLVVAGGVGLFACLHYVLWGRNLVEETRGEREELEAQREAEEWEAGQHPPGERRF